MLVQFQLSSNGLKLVLQIYGNFDPIVAGANWLGGARENFQANPDRRTKRFGSRWLIPYS